jgi:hypothetical protein
VESFSDGIDDNEILIKDVEVYRNSDGEALYSTPWLYISLNKKDNIRIEFQSNEFTENMNSTILESQLNLEKEKTNHE